MKRARVCGFLCALLGAIPWAGYAPPAAAYQPLITDDTGTQGAGGNQVEAAVNRLEFKTRVLRPRQRRFR